MNQVSGWAVCFGGVRQSTLRSEEDCCSEAAPEHPLQEDL